MDYPQILNVRDAAKFLRVSESIIRRLVREQRIPFFKIEGRYLFSRAVIENWVNELSITPTDKLWKCLTALLNGLGQRERIQQWHA